MEVIRPTPYVEIIVGSGAVEVLAPSFAPNHRLRALIVLKKWAKHCAASGNIIAIQGEQRARNRDVQGHLQAMTFQITAVTKPLASAGRSTARGYRIILDDEDASIPHRDRPLRRAESDKRAAEWYLHGCRCHA